MQWVVTELLGILRSSTPHVVGWSQIFGGGQEDVITGWPPLPGTQAIRGSSPPRLSLECTSAHRGQKSQCSKGVRYGWDSVDGMCVWRKPSKGTHTYTFKNLVGGCGGLLILPPPKASLVGKFAGLLNLPPTSAEWSASFFGLLLPFVHPHVCLLPINQFLFTSGFLGPITRNFNSTGLRWGSRIFIANKYPDNIDTVAFKTPFEKDPFLKCLIRKSYFRSGFNGRQHRSFAFRLP